MLSNPYKNISRVTQNRKIYIHASHPQEIWKDVVDKDLKSIKELCTAMSQLVYEVGVPKVFVHFSAKLLYNLVYRWWGHYIKESDYLASQCSFMSNSLMAFLQRQYTLAHMGCSVVMTWDAKKEEMVCFRSLDWKGADDIAWSTRHFSFINKEGSEIAQIAGITGMVGVLTGAKKGFSVAINYAPKKRSAKFKSDPTFLIRQLLEDENINSYEKAMKQIVSWELGSPCFISLCGVQKGDACVIELDGKTVHIRTMGEKNFLIQTNHYDLEASPFVEHNETPYTKEMSEKQWYESELLKNSQKREEIFKQSLSKPQEEEMESSLISLYKEVPILNYETAQWVFMQPKSGKVDVYTCIDK